MSAAWLAKHMTAACARISHQSVPLLGAGQAVNGDSGKHCFCEGTNQRLVVARCIALYKVEMPLAPDCIRPAAAQAAPIVTYTFTVLCLPAKGHRWGGRNIGAIADMHNLTASHGRRQV